MSERRQCECCGIIEGGFCREVLREYKGKLICSFCIVAWEKKEVKLNREITLAELKSRGLK